MKTNHINSWFTLIEIIVVISIIVLITGSWIFYFNNFLWWVKIKSDISKINSILEEFDNKVKYKEIFDYELYLKSWDLGFYYYENKFDLDNFLKATSLNFASWTWVLELHDSAPSKYLQLFLYNDSRVISEKVLGSSESLPLSFSWYSEYKVVSYLSGTPINNVWINYFSESNLDYWSENLLFLEEILDENGEYLSDITIKNIWWRKSLGNNFSKIILIFENNWRKEKLVISE